MENQRKVIALGFFDGVHLGHGALLRRVAEIAGAENAVPCAFTFDRSPAAVLTGREIPLLTAVEDRRWLMETLYGIRELIVAPFSLLRDMDWRDFVADYLQKELGAVHAVAGHDFRFGRGGGGNPQRLKDLCGEQGLGCDIIPKVEVDGVTVSSTHIRALIAEGELEKAARFLGHPHSLSGTVAHGRGLGRTLGTPTANLPVQPGMVIPAFGVYASRVILPDGEVRPAVANVGVRPTVDREAARVTVEPWILDYRGDLYGKTVRLELYKRLRPERRFGSVDELRAAILRNAEETRQFFAAEERAPC